MYRLLLSCPDRPGVVAATTTLLAERGANIIEADQHSDEQLVMRLVFEGIIIDDNFVADFDLLADEWQMDYSLHDAERQAKVVLMGSSQDHCLVDLLWRAQQQFIPAQVTHLIANKDNHQQLADYFNLPFIYLASDDMNDHEEQLLATIPKDTDLVVLARYMKVLSAEFLDNLPCPAINIHHSFLPAFPGAGPYQQAFDRGVKIIGATAHYVTADLDQGPIIDQDVVRVSHRQDPAQLAQIGADLERVVLARALLAHLEDRVIISGQRTIVF